ncbi:hypothetical protein H1R20_g9456, partial [Candolleomyces eurysporus]
MYARHQRRYDPFFNEWDCSDEFQWKSGYVLDKDNDDNDDNDDKGRVKFKATPPVPQPTTNTIISQLSEGQAPFSELDPAPDLFRPSSPSASNPSNVSPPLPLQELPFNAIQAEVEDAFGRFYGFCAPTLGTEFPNLSITEQSTDAFLHLLGLVSKDLTFTSQALITKLHNCFLIQ